MTIIGLSFIVFLVCFSLEVNSFEPRFGTGLKIIGGDFANKDQFPYQVALIYKGRLKCGGSIIGPKCIITAAHCVDRIENNSRLKVLAGTINLNFNGLRRDVDAIIIHDKYTRTTNYNDVALLKLAEELPFSASISPIKILEGEIPTGSDVIIAGWGRTSKTSGTSARLKYNTLSAYDLAECIFATGVAHKGILCLGHSVNNGACFGDSGGSAVYSGKLAGIASFVIGDCGTAKPDGYAKISYYVDWIRNHTHVGLIENVK